MGFLNILTGGLLNVGKDIFNGIQTDNAITRAGTQQLNAINQAGQRLTGATDQADTTLRTAESDTYQQALDVAGSIQQGWSPYAQTGQQALLSLNDAANAQTQFKAPSAEDIKAQLDPSMAYTMDQGLQALQRSAAGRGRLNAGGTLKDINTFAQGLASTNYGNAYNRAFQTSVANYTSGQQNQANRFNRNFSLAEMGYGATGNMANATQTFGNQVIGNRMRTDQEIAANQLGLGASLGNLDLRAGQVRADQTMGKVGNVIGSVNNGLYDLGSMFPGGFGGIRRGTYSGPRTIDPNAEIYS